MLSGSHKSKDLCTVPWEHKAVVPGVWQYVAGCIDMASKLNGVIFKATLPFKTWDAVECCPWISVGEKMSCSKSKPSNAFSSRFTYISASRSSSCINVLAFYEPWCTFKLISPEYFELPPHHKLKLKESITIWSILRIIMLIHTFRGQFEQIQRQHGAFLLLWRESPFVMPLSPFIPPLDQLEVRITLLFWHPSILQQAVM